MPSKNFFNQPFSISFPTSTTKVTRRAAIRRLISVSANISLRPSFFFLTVLSTFPVHSPFVPLFPIQTAFNSFILFFPLYFVLLPLTLFCPYNKLQLF